MKGLPRRPRRVAQTHAVAEKQKYLAVPSEEIKAASVAGLPAGAFRNASVTHFRAPLSRRPAVNKRLDAFWRPIHFSSIYQTNGTNRYRTF
jgi:hypothetical protein